MISGPIIAWQIEGEKVEVVTDFLFLGSKIPGDGDSSHDIRWFLLGRKVMTNLDRVSWKKRHYTADKRPYSQGYGLPSGHIQLWEQGHKEGRTLKNWCLWTVVLEKIPRVPWTARRSNQSILWEINSEYSLEELMLKMKLQYFAHLIHTDDSLEKSLMLGEIKGRRGHQRMRWLDGIPDAMNENVGKLGDGEGQGGLVCCNSWGCKESDKTGWLNNSNNNSDNAKPDHSFIHSTFLWVSTMWQALSRTQDINHRIIELWSGGTIFSVENLPFTMMIHAKLNLCSYHGS